MPLGGALDGYHDPGASAVTWQAWDTARSYFVPSTTEPGLELHVRAQSGAAPGAPVLFVHGATYASRLYDIPHDGASWLSATAAAGFTAYALDVRGYGKSRSKVMETATAPYGRADEVVHDVSDVAAWICERHKTDQLAVVGGSWGSITAALYATGPGKARVARLVLYAPIFAERNEGWLELLADPAKPGCFGPQWGAFRWVDEAGTRARWDAELPPGQADAWRDEAVFQALVRASLADDPLAQGRTPPAFRAPNGTLVDLWSAFNGQPLYDPAALQCPVLLIRGAQDPTSTRSDALALFDRLGSDSRNYVEIANGAHFLTAERRAPEVFGAVNAFLSR